MRPFAEVISTYRLRFDGLNQEYMTIEHKWRYLGSIMMDERVFPDLSSTFFTVIPELMKKLDEEISQCEKIAESTIESDLNLTRDRTMKSVSDQLFLIARVVSYFKSSFYQRTNFLEIPFVIAGEPISPETRWGDELYLIAADNLIRDYYRKLILNGFGWTGFSSYTLIHPHHERFPGATYANIANQMFQISLSSEMKYFLSGFLVISHELGHAAIESMEVRTEQGKIPEIMYRFLYDLHLIRRRLYLYLHKFCARETNPQCKYCSFKSSMRRIAYASKEFEEFVDISRTNPISELFYEIISDCVGMVISGPYYIRALIDYTLRNIMSEESEDQSLELDRQFQKIFIRVASCYYFAQSKKFNWAETSQKIYENLVAETFSSIAFANASEKHKLVKCLSCLRIFASILGRLLARDFEFIFENIFHDKAVFNVDLEVIDQLSRGVAVCNAQPRQIIHACFELMQNGRTEFPVALFSLANNTGCLG